MLHREYNGKAYDGFRVGELANCRRVKFGYHGFKGQFEEFTQSEIGERVRFKLGDDSCSV